MIYLKFSLIFSLLFSPIFATNSQGQRLQRVASQMKVAAKKLTKSLDRKKREKLIRKKKKIWNFLPNFRLGIKRRKGLSFKKLNKQQVENIWGLLRSGMSLLGLDTIKLLRVLEANHKKRPGAAVIAVKYDPLLYYITIYGNPDSPNWAWRFEGHHLSLNFTIKNGSVVSRSPTFMGANPSIIPNTKESGKHVGKPVLKNHTRSALLLFNSLSKKQKGLATVKGLKFPEEVILVPKKKARTLKPLGISFTKLNGEQKMLFMNIIMAYTSQFRREIANLDILRIRKAGKNKLHFLWIGKSTPGEPFYYRLQGPTFILEFDHSTGDPNHIHSVWRDKNEANLLRDHYQLHGH